MADASPLGLDEVRRWLVSRRSSASARAFPAAGAVAILAGALAASWGPAAATVFLASAALLGAGITALCGGPLRYAAARVVPSDAHGPAQAMVTLATNAGLLVGSALLRAVSGSGFGRALAMQVAIGATRACIAITSWPVITLARARGMRAND